MKQEEIVQFSMEDLKDKIFETEEKYTKMKLSHAVSTLENPIQLRNLRRDIARLKTELTKRENNA